ncbi:NAD-binding protein [Candidatus Woesearchaeota archaeon]|nr:NAD-binding protein [Candidatus Woesearchaeota archaeon]
MRVIIIGGGQVGRTLVNVLSSQDYEVTLVEKDDGVAKELAQKSDITVIKGDGTEMSILKDAKIEEADAVVTLTNDDKTNLMISEIAKSNNVNKIISRVNDPKNEELFTKLGINLIVPMVGLAVTSIKRMLMRYGEERIISELGEGNIQVVELKVGEKSSLVEKEAELKGAVIGSIYRDGELKIPTKATKIKAGDVLIITVKTEDLPKLNKLISGE